MKKIIAALLLAALVLAFAGCSSTGETEEVPELLEPVNATRSSYIVKRMDIYNFRQYDGIVVPELTEIETKFDGFALETCVHIGDMVQEGDVLFRYDVSQTQERMESLQSEINYLNTDGYYANSIVESSIKIARKELEKLQAAEEPSQVEILRKEQEIESLNLQLQQQRESQYLNTSYLQKQYDELAEIAENDTITAPVSGRIVYARNYILSDRVPRGTVTFLIADDSKLKIRGPYMQNSYIRYIVQMEAYSNSRVYPIKIEEMTREQMTAKAIAGEAVFSYFVTEDSQTLTAGDYVKILLYTQGTDDCIAVPVNAMFRDAKGNFVYLLDEENNMTRRDVQTGRSTDLYIEIKEGLEGGERIYVKD